MALRGGQAALARLLHAQRALLREAIAASEARRALGTPAGAPAASAREPAAAQAPPPPPQSPPPPPPHYPTHVPLNPIQRASVAVLASLGAVLRPARADLVAAAGETLLGEPALRAAAARLRRAAARGDPDAALLLAERPRVTDATLEHCRTLPADTLGGAYASFMGDRGFAASERPPVRFVDAGAEAAWVAARQREVHDFWHVLFGLPTTVLGELALKAVELVQTGLPSAGMAVLAAQLRLSAEDRAALWGTYVPWAARAGARCADLVAIYYERHFDEPLDDVRRRWRVEVAPQGPFEEAARRVKAERRKEAREEPGGGGEGA
jgi:ubiquinone biosynthesis protein COQ4